MADTSEPADSVAQDLTPQAAAETGVSSTNEVQVEVRVTPPPKFVHTIRELIYWEYAKLIARAAHRPDNYGFITSRFKKLQDGSMHWSDIDKDVGKQIGRIPKCEYCGTENVNLAKDHIIPLVKGGPDTPGNIVMACQACNSSKGDHDIFEWYYVIRGEKQIPKMVFSKYLKLIWDFHVAHHTLDRSDLNHDGTLNILDLGAIFKKYEEKR